MPRLMPATLGASALLAAISLAVPAQADVVFQTATFDAAAPGFGNVIAVQGDGTTQGDGFLGGSLFIGADFVVTRPTQVSDVGANFMNTATTSSSGAIFAAIVEVDPSTGLPTQPVESLTSIMLGSTVFTPMTDGDSSGALSVVLQPGTYGLVFGSGLLGATGVADLLLGNDTVGTPSVFENDFAPFQADPFDADVRLFVDGTPVPEPGSMTLLGVGIVLAGIARRRRAR